MVTDFDDAAGVAELAELLHCPPTTVGNWAAVQPTFPPPERQLAMGPLYSIKRVLTWHYGWQPKRKIRKGGWIDDDLLLHYGLTTEPETPGENNGQSQG